MKYYYEKPETWIGAGKVYICNHTMYRQCTLFQNGDVGLAVIQERYDPEKKVRWWSYIDPWLAGDIFLNKKFEGYFVDHARQADERGIFPTYKVREVMWALRMKPLKKEYWEEF